MWLTAAPWAVAVGDSAWHLAVPGLLCQDRVMSINIDETEKQARALLDARIESVRAVVNARQTVADLRDQLAAAEREDARLYNAALRDGWSADELKKLGIAEPEKAPKARKRAPRKKTSATPSAPSSASAAEQPDAPEPVAQAS